MRVGGARVPLRARVRSRRRRRRSRARRARTTAAGREHVGSAGTRSRTGSTRGSSWITSRYDASCVCTARASVGIAVEQRRAVERREQPLVRVDDERVGGLDSVEPVADARREQRGAAVRGVDVHPEAAVAAHRARSRRGRRRCRRSSCPPSRRPRRHRQLRHRRLGWDLRARPRASRRSCDRLRSSTTNGRTSRSRIVLAIDEWVCSLTAMRSRCP